MLASEFRIDTHFLFAIIFDVKTVDLLLFFLEAFKSFWAVLWIRNWLFLNAIHLKVC